MFCGDEVYAHYVTYIFHFPSLNPERKHFAFKSCFFEVWCGAIFHQQDLGRDARGLGVFSPHLCSGLLLDGPIGSHLEFFFPVGKQPTATEGCALTPESACTCKS